MGVQGHVKKLVLFIFLCAHKYLPVRIVSGLFLHLGDSDIAEL